jgi:serine kinase of HPr protein (carbohydrate metabolism regulator)
MVRLRGTCIALDGHAVLLRGRSTAGKSDLALRLIDAGGSLVSDDYTDVAPEDGRLVASAPPPLHGLLEVRGLGVVRLEALPSATLVAAVDLMAPDQLDRMPPPRFEAIEGISLAVFRISPFEASAVAKVRLIARVAAGTIALVE